MVHTEQDRLGASRAPSETPAPGWSDDEWAEIAFHAGMTAEADQRHKAIFFDAFVPAMVAHIDQLRAERE